MHVWNVLQAARWKYTTLSGNIFGPKACIDNRKKNLLNSNTSSRCRDNMVNFGLPTAAICWRVWVTPANFNGFRILAALLHGCQPNLAALKRGRHLYSAGRLSRWALAHILVVTIMSLSCTVVETLSVLQRTWLHACDLEKSFKFNTLVKIIGQLLSDSLINIF